MKIDRGVVPMTQNLKIFTGLVVMGTVAYLAIGDLVPHLPQTAQTIASFVMLFLFFYIVFNLVHRVIYRLTGVTKKLMFKGRTDGWPRPTHQQAAEINKYWQVWLAGSILTYLGYTAIFHRLEWKNALIFGAVVLVIVGLARLSSKRKIAGHTKEEIFK